ncbi:MAG: hypothetical protein ABS69_11600 [Nitrosomonadales bacterium SCN 54-20]|nr:MAG: hypothetical protein ABS69_11600 [Nitrosomonadales bacterium SCN 54-20]
MAKVLTLSLRCSSKLLTEQLKQQQQLYIRLIAKLLKLFMSVGILAKMLKVLCPLPRLSSLAETRMNKGFYYVAHISTLGEHLSQPEFTGPSGRSFRCGANDPEKALATLNWWGGRFGVVYVVNRVVVGEAFQ